MLLVTVTPSLLPRSVMHCVPFDCGALQAAVYAWAVLNYPKPRAHTSSYVYTVTFLGAHLGLSAGDAAAWRGSRAAVALHSAALRALPAGVVQQLATLAAPSTAGNSGHVTLGAVGACMCR